MASSFKLLFVIAVALLLSFSGQTSRGQNVTDPPCKEGDYDCVTLEQARSIAVKCKGEGETCRIAEYSKMIEANPLNGAAYFGRGRAIWTTDLERAVQDLNRAIEINPSYFQSYISLGILYCAVKKSDEAIHVFGRALEVAEHERRDAGYRRISYIRNAHVNRGAAYHQKRDFERALADYNQAIKLGPTDDAGYSGRGSVYANLNDFERAIADYSKAIELNPSYWLNYYIRGHLLLKHGDPSKGNADLKKSEELKKAQNDN